MAISFSYKVIIPVLTLLICLAIVVPVLATFDSGWQSFAMVGQFFQGDKSQYHSRGYDGQFYYMIALHGREATPFLDYPSYRYIRIGYPLLAVGLSLGSETLLPAMLVLINITAIVLGTGLLANLLKNNKANPYWAVAYPLWIGTIFSLRLDLAEPLCMVLGLGAVLAYKRKRWWLAALLLVLATLTKEMGLVFAGGLALHALYERHIWQSIQLTLPPLFAYLGWMVLLDMWLPANVSGHVASHLEFPLVGWWKIADPATKVFAAMWLVVPAIVLLVVLVTHVTKTRSFHLEDALLAVSIVFLLTMPDVTWEDFFAASRVGLPFIITGLLYMSRHPRLNRWMTLWWGASCLVVLMAPSIFVNL